MEKYSDVKEFIDNYKEKIADDFDNIEDYYLILRIGQMYRELEQVKLSYEKLLNTEKVYTHKDIEELIEAVNYLE